MTFPAQIGRLDSVVAPMFIALLAPLRFLASFFKFPPTSFVQTIIHSRVREPGQGKYREWASQYC
jgi:hypothetical protein